MGAGNQPSGIGMVNIATLRGIRDMRRSRRSRSRHSLDSLFSLGLCTLFSQARCAPMSESDGFGGRAGICTAGDCRGRCMEGLGKLLGDMIPFLSQYPPWVRACAVLWVFVTATIVAILLLVPRTAPARDLAAVAQTPQAVGQVQSGEGNIQAGRDVTILQGDRRTDGLLEITHVDFTHQAEFDVMVRNLGDTDLIIHKIAAKKVEDPGIGVLPILRPTAKYHIPVDDLPVGGTKSISVSHVVPARSADRFLIALHTTNVYVLQITLYYNTDMTVSFTKKTWM